MSRPPSSAKPPRVHPRDPHGREYQEAALHGRRAIVHGTKGAQMCGFVFDEHFHVHDTQHGGASYRDLTGERPVYGPIPLSKIAELGHRLEYLNDSEKFPFGEDFSN